MKYLLSLILVMTGAVSSASEAQIGIILGSISGLSGKIDLGGNRSIAAALAYSSESRYGTHIHADYLIERSRQLSAGQLNPIFFYYGPGLKMVNIRSGVDNGKMRIAFRVPFGLNIQTSNPDLEFFGELAPTVDLTPSTSVYVDGGLGLRFRF